MSNSNNRQKNRVNGNKNVVGNNNIVNSRREDHHHHHYGSSSNGWDNGDDAIGIGIGVLGASLTTIWFFAQHSAEVYTYIKLGTLISALPFFAVVTISMIWNTLDNKQFTGALFGLVLSAASFFIAQYGQESLDPRLFELSQQSRNAWVFWQGLNEHGHNLVVGSLAGAVCTGAAVLFSLFMGIFVLWEFLDESDTENSILLRLLSPFRPSRGGVFTIILLFVAWAFVSGFAFEIIA